MTRFPRLAGISALMALASAFVMLPARADFAPAITLQAATPEAGAQFGYSAAAADVNGDGFADVVIGAPRADFGGHTDCGEVTVLLGPSLADLMRLHAPALEDSSHFGWSVTAADFNGDGFADVAVGSPYATVSGYAWVGSTTIFFGPSLATSITIDNPQPAFNAQFGFSLAAADVNGDGKADLLVGAPNATVDGKEFAGRSFVFLGPSFSTSYALQAPQPEAQTSFGRALAGADIDRDGKDEVIVGAPDYGADVLNAGPGLAYVFHGPSLDTVTTVHDPEPEPGAYFGGAVAGGDFNGDGYDDLLIGAYDSNRWPYANAGRAFIFTAPSLSSFTVLEQPVVVADSAYFGYELTAADVNHDGYADAVIGAHDADISSPPATGGGEADIFFGPSFQAVIHFQDPQPELFAHFSRSVAVGDVNGDGLGEFIAGAPGSSVNGAADAGQAFVFFNVSTPTVTPTPTSTLTITPPGAPTLTATPAPAQPVGGIAEPPQLEPSAPSGIGGSSGPNILALAGLASGAVFVLATAGWYARRRSLR